MKLDAAALAMAGAFGETCRSVLGENRVSVDRTNACIHCVAVPR